VLYRRLWEQVLCGWVFVDGMAGRHSQVGGEGVSFLLPHRQHEVGDARYRASLVSVVLPMLLHCLYPDPGRDNRLLVCDLHPAVPRQG
jgi:hypothetical protein